HTRSKRDWSSDVCSSDLYGIYPWFLSWAVPRKTAIMEKGPTSRFWSRRFIPLSAGVVLVSFALGLGLTRLNTDPNLLDYFKPHRSEERRVGKECRSRRLM